MKAIEQMIPEKCNRNEWGSGPWDNEPDKIKWQDDETGYQCFMLRNQFGAWCGYVSIPEEHPFYGMESNRKVQIDKEKLMTRKVGNSPPLISIMLQDKEEFEKGIVTLDLSVEVHGGITFTGEHFDEPGAWWIGFDCSHCDDRCPGMNIDFIDDMQIYRNREYVENEIRNLAEQLKEIHASS